CRVALPGKVESGDRAIARDELELIIEWLKDAPHTVFRVCLPRHGEGGLQREVRRLRHAHEVGPATVDIAEIELPRGGREEDLGRLRAGDRGRRRVREGEEVGPDGYAGDADVALSIDRARIRFEVPALIDEGLDARP